MIARLVPGYEGEGATRVIVGLTELEIFRAALKAWRDPEVSSIVLHKKGSRFRLPNGQEIVVGLRPAECDLEPAGSC